jgi:hypothetical protein
MLLFDWVEYDPEQGTWRRCGPVALAGRTAEPLDAGGR